MLSLLLNSPSPQRRPLFSSLLLGLLSFCASSHPIQAAAPTPSASPLQSRFFVHPERGSDSSSGLSSEDPFKTLERARDEIRKIPRPLTGEIHVLLLGENYRLQTPFLLKLQDGGEAQFRVRYMAAPGEKPRLSGGFPLTKWKAHDTAKNIYRSTPEQPVATRQLFVNGRRAVRARSVAGVEGIERVEEGYKLPVSHALGDWKNPSDMEFVYRHIWTNPRVGIEQVAKKEDHLLVSMKQPGFGNARNKGMTSVNLPWYVENAYELLDEPGEWYLDRTGAAGGVPGAIYYKAYDWEDPKTLTGVVPVLEQLIQVEGEGTNKPVENLSFEGLTFAETTWLRPSSPFGLPDAQNNVMRENFAKFGKAGGDEELIIDGAALRLRYARKIEILGCRFMHLGGTAVSFSTAGARDNKIVGSTFVDISANGIQIGDYRNWHDPKGENAPFPEDSALLSTNNLIRNNYFNRCGVDYRSAMPIGIAYPRDSVIANNEIYNSPYSGIHLGWCWDRAPKTAMGKNLIEANRVQNSMVEMADGGALYTLGASDPDYPATLIRRNYALQTRWGQGFYFDESSSYYDVVDNVIEQIGDANIKFNGKDNNHISVTGLYSDKDRNIVSKGLDMAKLHLSIEPARLVKEPANAEVANRIKAQAGLESNFTSARHVVMDRVIHELEDYDLSTGAYVTNGMDRKPPTSGYCGMGYVDNLARRPGASVSVKALVSQGGTYELRLRYSATGAPVAGMNLTVNGVSSALPELPVTSEPSAWSTVRQKVELKAGENTLVLAASAGHKEQFYADRIELVPLR